MRGSEDVDGGERSSGAARWLRCSLACAPDSLGLLQCQWLCTIPSGRDQSVAVAKSFAMSSTGAHLLSLKVMRVSVSPCSFYVSPRQSIIPTCSDLR